MAITLHRAATDPVRSMLEHALAPMHGWGGRLGGMLRVPPAEVVETENDIRVFLELPGVGPGDVNVELESNVLTVSGEKREERTEGDAGDTWHLSERRYGMFSRSFVLPGEVEPDRIQARCEDGVLSITIPRSERARRRRIEVRNGGGQPRNGANGGATK